MRHRSRLGRKLAVLLAGVAGTLALAGCGHPAPASTVAGCRAFGVRAIEHHLVVRTVPSACAGLTRLQVNESVAEAVHAAEGANAKATGRRIAALEARYLARLIRGGLQSPESAAAAASGPARAGDGLRIAALVSWAITAAVGIYLLTGWRRGRVRGRPPGLAIGHAGAATAGLGTWAAFASAGEPALAWTAAALAFTAAGLGMAVLVGSVPVPAAGPPASDPGAGSRRVLLIATHGMFAAVTMALVLYAAFAGG
jgi:hypothetical protein